MERRPAMILLLQAAQPGDSAILVEVIQVPSQTIGDVVRAAVGISGVLALAGVLFGLVLGLAFIAAHVHHRRRAGSESTDHQRLHLST
jgi:hypothetical protein